MPTTAAYAAAAKLLRVSAGRVLRLDLVPGNVLHACVIVGLCAESCGKSTRFQRQGLGAVGYDAHRIALLWCFKHNTAQHSTALVTARLTSLPLGTS